MNSSIQSGYLTLADISGYTTFMATTELEHAHEILSDFLHLVIDRMTPTFTLAEVEGDAVFAYTPGSKLLRGETLLELIESTYYDFRHKRDVMYQRTTCTCNACRQIPTLDLKFITHYGEYALQTVAGSVKPVGSDVNIAHRLLKNKVAEKTGWRGYALFSDKTFDRLQVNPDGIHTQTDSYEHIGDVETYSYNLNDTLAKTSETKRYFLTEKDSDYYASRDFKTSPAILWSWLTDPGRRALWQKGTKWSAGERPQGRTGIGAVNHCAHGKNFEGTSIEEILDWRPFEYYTCEVGDAKMKLIITHRLTQIDGGTRDTCYVKMKKNLPGFIRRPLVKFITNKSIKWNECLDNIERLIEESSNTQAIPA